MKHNVNERVALCEEELYGQKAGWGHKGDVKNRCSWQASMCQMEDKQKKKPWSYKYHGQ